MAASPAHLDRLTHISALEARLAQKGIDISVRDHIRLVQLLQGLRDAGVSITSGEQAAGWFTPILARNRETAQQVREVVAQWWEAQAQPGALDATREILDDVARDPVIRRRALAGLAIICAVMAAIAVVVLIAEPTVETVVPDTPELTDGGEIVIEPDEPELFDNARDLPTIMLLIVFPSVLFLAPFAWGVWYFLRPPAPKFIDRGAAARVRPVKIPLKPVGTSVFVDANSRMALRRLAAPDIVPTRNLDIPRSIAASISGSDRGDLVFRKRTRARDYVMIVEASSGEDHIHLVADALLEQARMANIDMPRYELRSHLSFLRYVDGGRQGAKSDSLGTIARRHMGARLLILGSGDGLFDDRGELLTHLDGARPRAEDNTMFGYFERPALLSTTPFAFMGNRERQLQDAGIELAPMSPEGLDRIAHTMTADDVTHVRRPPLDIAQQETPLFAWIRRARLDLLSDIPPTAEEIDDLRLELRGYFRGSGDWPIFLALMLMPTTITCKLTLSLLHYLELEADERRIKNTDADGNLIKVTLPRGYSRLSTLARLARLPWFQAGYAPDWLRATVIHHSDPDEVGVMRNVLQRLMEDEGHLPRSAGSENLAVHEDDWALSLYTEDALGARVASERELPLIKVLRGEDVTELAQPLTLQARPSWTKIGAAIVTGAAGIAALAILQPDGVFSAIAFLANFYALQIWSGFDSDGLIFLLSLGTASLLVIDCYAQAEDGGRNWLARLLSPSRAFIAFAKARRADVLAEHAKSSEPVDDAVLRSTILRLWDRTNPYLFKGLRKPRLRDGSRDDNPRLKGITSRDGSVARIYDRLVAHWEHLADRADRRTAWIGRAIEAVLIFVVLSDLNALLVQFSLDDFDGATSVAFLIVLWTFAVLITRAYRWSGRWMPPLIAWRIEGEDTLPRRNTHIWLARLVPVMVPVSILVYAMAVAASSSSMDIESPQHFYTWVSLGLVVAVVLQSIRQIDQADGSNLRLRSFLLDWTVGVAAVTFPLFFMTGDLYMVGWCIPAAVLLIVGQGFRLTALVIIGVAISDGMFFDELLADLWLGALRTSSELGFVLASTLLMILVYGIVSALLRPRIKKTAEEELDDAAGYFGAF